MTLTLPLRGRFWIAAAVAGLSLWASGAPSALYPHYASAWALPTVATTAIFAVYPLVLVPVLLIFGGVSDYIGRRAAILIGLGALLVGALVLALAPDLGWVIAGRALTGVGVGFSLSPATAGMVEWSGADGSGRASSATTAATATGLALATLVSGALLEYLPDPLHLSFWVLFVVTLVVGVGVWFLPRQTAQKNRARWRPQPPRVPAGLRMSFLAATLGVSGAYAFGAIYLSLGAQVATDLVGSHNDLVNGAILSISAIAIGVSAIALRALPPRFSITIGAIAAASALVLLIVSGLTLSLVAFLSSSIVGGLGYSLLFSGGLGILAVTAPTHHRAGMLSSAYTVAYLLQALLAIGVGTIATTAGLQIAIELGTIAVTVIVAIAVLFAQSRSARPVAES